MSKSDLNKTWTLLPDPDELNGTVSLVTQSDTSPSNPNSTFTADPSVAKTPLASNGTAAGHFQSLFVNGSANKPTVSKYSPSKSATDYLLIRHLNIDEARVSAEWDNFEARFQDLDSYHYESLFDEVFNFPEESSLKSEEEAVVNKVIKSEIKSVTPTSLSSCSSIDNNLDRLALSQTANEFNAQPLPNSFDMFMNDLKKSSSSKQLNENDSKSSSRLNLPFSDSKSVPFVSSMENELNKMPVSSSRDKPPFLESLDLQTSSSMRTSSPSKHNSVLNRTIDIEKGSSESLNHQSQTNLLANDDEENEVVLNTTYTSWSTDLNQAEKEACTQQEVINMKFGTGAAMNKNFTPNRTIVYSSSVQNLTQDINNNSLNNDNGFKNKKVDLNRTYEMDEMMDVDDDQLIESQTGEAETGTNRILNRTHDLIDDEDLEPAQSAANITITKPVIAAPPSGVNKVSSQTSSSRLTTMYNKPKTTTSTKTQSPLQPKKTELIKPVVQVNNSAANNTKLPVRNSIPTQIKSGIPSIKLISSTTSQQSSGQLTKQQSFTSNTTTTSNQQDVNRLSSSSTASSASTGSTKENRKSISNVETKLVGETTNSAKSSSFGFVSKLKKPGVVAPTSQTNIPTTINKMTSGISKLPSGSSIPAIPKMPSSSALPTTALKNPTQVSKKPGSVLTLRNANSQLKK